MKKLFMPLLLVPGAAWAGLTIVSGNPALDQAKQQQGLLMAQATPSKLMPTSATPAAAAIRPVAQAAPTPALPVVKLQQWEIKAGDSLRTTLENWCERAGYRLVWNVDGGFRSQGGFVSEADFKQAVKDLFAAIPQDLHLDVDVTKNKLVIVTGGGQ